MTIRTIDRPQRQSYFDKVTHAMGATEAHIEISGNSIGVQPASDWVMLLGVTYDPERDSMDISLEDLDHRVLHPQEVYVDDGIDGLRSIQIVDADNNRQTILLRQPLQLTH